MLTAASAMGCWANRGVEITMSNNLFMAFQLSLWMEEYAGVDSPKDGQNFLCAYEAKMMV